MKQGSLREERNFNKFKNIDTEMMEPPEFSGRDMQAYMDLVKCGLDPWQCTYRLNQGVLSAYDSKTTVIIYEYDPMNRVWSQPCVKETPKEV